MPLKGTLSGSYGAPVTLTVATYAVPVTVTGTISLASAGIDLQAATPWSIINQGVIEAPDASGAVGVSLGAGGYVDNAAGGRIAAQNGIAIIGGGATVANSGTILGGTSGRGVYLSSGPATGAFVTNAASAAIAGGIGVFLGGATSGTVANSGSIAGLADGTGIDLASGGSVGNAASAAITGYTAIFLSDAGSVDNHGSIAGSGTDGAGIFLNAGGTVTNAASASIGGGLQGIAFSGSAGVLVNDGSIGGSDGTGVVLHAGGSIGNAGTITGGAGSGVSMAAGGTVSNTGSGLISAHAGVYFSVMPGTVVNAATIEGGFGVEMRAGGRVANLSAGVIRAGAQNGIYISGFAGTVSNAGSIINTSSNYSAIYVRSGGRVDNQAGGVISSTYHAIDATHAALTVSNAGLIGNSNSSYSAIALDAGGSVANAAGGTIVSGYHGVYISGGGTITNAGSIGVTGASTIAVDLVGGFPNLVVADPGAVFGGAVQGGNLVGGGAVSVLELAAGAGTLDGIGPTFQNFGSIAFDAGAAWTISGSTAGLAGGETIGGFTSGDTIDLVGVSETIGGFAGGTLTLTGTDALNLLLPGSFLTPQFHAAVSSGNTDITVACFVAGTRVLTDAGEVAVERLRPGARVVSLTHRRLLAVVWTGCWKVRDAWPVRVRAGAFGAGAPHRDLWLSPDHAVFVDGVLVPVRWLVNGASIAAEQRDEVLYYHVELAEHGVLVAEGLPAESFLDTGNLVASSKARASGGKGAVAPLNPLMLAAVAPAIG